MCITRKSSPCKSAARITFATEYRFCRFLARIETGVKHQTNFSSNRKNVGPAPQALQVAARANSSEGPLSLTAPGIGAVITAILSLVFWVRELAADFLGAA